MATKSRNRPTRTNGIAPGARVRTTGRFSALFEGGAQWRGQIVRAHSFVTGSWYVRVDGMAKLQQIHEKFLEVQP